MRGRGPDTPGVTPVATPTPGTLSRGAVRGRLASAARFTERRPDLLMYALAAMVLTYQWRFPSLVPALAVLNLGILVGVVSLGLFAADGSQLRRVVLVRSPMLSLMLGLLLLMVAGTPGAVVSEHAVRALLTEVVPQLLLAIMLGASVRSLRDVEWMAKVNLFGAFVFSVATLFRGEIGRAGRLAGVAYYDPNDTALVLVATLPFAVHAALRGKRFAIRLLGMISFALFVLVIIATGSRGAFLSFLVVMAFMLFRFEGISARARAGAVAAGTGLILLAAGESYWSSMKTLLNPTADYNWTGNSETGRMEVWKRGVGYMLARPVLGVGVRNFPSAEGRLSEAGQSAAVIGRGFKWSVAHSSYVEIGAEVGVIGLVLYVALLVTALRILHRVRSSASARGAPSGAREAALADMLTASLVAYIVCGLFISAQYFALQYLLLGLTLGLYKLSGLGAAARQAGGPPRGGRGVPTRRSQAPPTRG